jgi:cell division protein FtsQ
VLDAPETSRVPQQRRAAGLKRSAPVTEMPLRRDATHNDYDRYDEDAPDQRQRARGGVRISFRDGLIPKTLWGRIAAGCALMLAAGAVIVSALIVRSFLLHDARFVVPTSESIELAGAGHLTHAQLLSIFGEDVGRNIFTIPLNDRRAELERLPWVEHATVMRLLLDHLRVAIVERAPVAFVRQGPHIGLVDAGGALFDMPSPEMVASSGGATPHYSFPVLTGMSYGDPLSTRAARMKIYMAFVAALDATGEKISSKLSEVDLSNPEDLRAVIPDAGGSDVLVHFGEDHFLDRYHAYRQHLAEWRSQYPHLASVDMRYDRQVVLGMKPDAAGASHPSSLAQSTVDTTPVATAPSAPKPAAQAIPASITIKAPAHMTPAKTASRPTKSAHAKARSRKITGAHAHISANAVGTAHHPAAGVTQ